MATNKFYQRKKVINGKEYIAQFGGISLALKAVDASYIEGTSNTSVEKLAEYLFEHVIVEPHNLKIDDFDTMAEFNDVINFARGVMQGDFRDEADENAAAKKSGK